MKKEDSKLGIILGAFALGMLAVAFACVPIYKMFCQKTGYGGTPRVVDFMSSKTVDRTITVQFMGTTHRDLFWKFVPLQNQTKIRIGENAIAFYRTTNLTDHAIVGMATYNVAPDKAAIYFNKVACFCFEEQTLKARQTVDMPVQFFIDPEFANDPNLKDVDTITLSYTFFEIKK
jgi:cytochrome c oxidase assembly protein subunit 11